MSDAEERFTGIVMTGRPSATRRRSKIARMTGLEESTEITDPAEIAALRGNPFLSRYLDRHGSKAMYGGYPLGCNYRYFYRGWSKLASLEKAEEGCKKKIDQRNRDFNMQCSCRLVAIGNTLLFDDDVYRSNQNLQTDYMMSRIPQEDLLSDEKICTRALNYYFPNQWSKADGDLDFVKIAQQRGYSTDDCNHILGRPVNRSSN